MKRYLLLSLSFVIMSSSITPSAKPRVSAEENGCKQLLDTIFDFYNTTNMELLFPGLNKDYRYVEDFASLKLLDQGKKYDINNIIENFNNLMRKLQSKIDVLAIGDGTMSEWADAGDKSEMIDNPLYQKINTDIEMLTRMKSQLLNIKEQCPSLFVQSWATWGSSFMPKIPYVNA